MQQDRRIRALATELARAAETAIALPLPGVTPHQQNGERRVAAGLFVDDHSGCWRAHGIGDLDGGDVPLELAQEGVVSGPSKGGGHDGGCRDGGDRTQWAHVTSRG